MSVPYPDPVVISILTSLSVLSDVDGRVSTELLSPLPAVRITKVYDRGTPTTWEAAPVYQVEIWADDEFQCGSLAWALKNAWPSATAQVVGDALVHGRWVDTNPVSSPDPETGQYRHLVNLGISLSGATS